MKTLKTVALACLASSALGAMAETRLWVSEAEISGNIGGRADADAFCLNDVNNPQISGATTRAFLSISANDEIRDMPSNYGVPEDEVIYRADGTTRIAANFAALLNTANQDLDNAVLADIFLVWTGSTVTGALDTINNCEGFQSESGSVLGMVGSTTNTASVFISAVGAPARCEFALQLYCVSFDAPVPPGVPGAATGLEW